ncbi:MAG: amidohydrolase family protein [Gemmatimonadaceae bacterium]
MTRRTLIDRRGGVSEALVAFLLLSLVAAHTLPAQARAADRRALMEAGHVETTDDPRRIPVPRGPKGPVGAIVVRGGRIFDGTGAAAREGTLVIERNKVARILPADARPGANGWPSGAKVIEGAGKTVMPGMIDLHTHLTYADTRDPEEEALSEPDAVLRAVERLRYFVESGITSVRDVASMGDVTFRLKDWVARNRIPGPRVFAAGQLLTSVSGHGAQGMGSHPSPNVAIRVLSGPFEWRNAVRDLFDRGADVIKVASHFSKEEVQAAIDEAHTLGLKVTCDCESIYTQWAVEAGVDMIEHPLPRSDETIRLMAEKKVEADPTLVTYSYLFASYGGGYFGSTSRRFYFNDSTNQDMLRRMKKAGIKMGIGTDLVIGWYRALPGAYITELKSFVQAGYSIPEALVAATKTSAELLDMGDKLGTLEPGKLADVLIVDGRPDANLDDLAKVDVVIRDGNVVVRGGEVVVPRHLQEAAPKASERTSPQ